MEHSNINQLKNLVTDTNSELAATLLPRRTLTVSPKLLSEIQATLHDSAANQLPCAFLNRYAVCLTSIVERILPESPQLLWDCILKIGAQSEPERSQLLFDFHSGSFSVVKLLWSIRRALDARENPIGILAGLIQDREASALLRSDHATLMHRLTDLIELDPKRESLRRCLTVSAHTSFQDRPILGNTFYVIDENRRMKIKLRITEFYNPIAAQTEWNLGVVSQDSSSGRIKPEERYQALPGELFHHTRVMLNHSRVERIKTLAAEYGVQTIDLMPAYYHLYVILKRRGADLDPLHPQYKEDRAHIDKIEELLSTQAKGGIREQTWTIYDQRLIDYSSRQPILWKIPRMIMHTALI